MKSCAIIILNTRTMITGWECGLPDSELKAFMEYTKSYDLEGTEATVEVRVEFRSE